MKFKLQGGRLWEAVHVGGVDYDDDRRALEALCATVPTELGASLTNKATTKLAWESIAAACIGGDRVRRASCSASEGSGKASLFSLVSKSRTLPFVLPI